MNTIDNILVKAFEHIRSPNADVVFINTMKEI
jgi:hypothetical protein